MLEAALTLVTYNLSKGCLFACRFFSSMTALLNSQAGAATSLPRASASREAISLALLFLRSVYAALFLSPDIEFGMEDFALVHEGQNMIMKQKKIEVRQKNLMFGRPLHVMAQG